MDDRKNLAKNTQIHKYAAHDFGIHCSVKYPMSKQSPPKPNTRNWIEQVQNAGFIVVERQPGTVRISKYGCAAELETSPAGQPRFAVQPGLLVGESIACLLDRGYQKFWQDGPRLVPAVADQLKALHRFDEDWRAAMGLTTLYNEALGTVSARYVYDRVEGREGPKKHHPFD